MDDLDDIKFAVSLDGEIIAFFKDEENAETFRVAIKSDEKILSRKDSDFYIDIDCNPTSRITR